MKTQTWLSNKAQERSLLETTSRFAMSNAFSAIINPSAYTPGHSDSSAQEGATDLEP
jgi:hypothetical protein